MTFRFKSEMAYGPSLMFSESLRDKNKSRKRKRRVSNDLKAEETDLIIKENGDSYGPLLTLQALVVVNEFGMFSGQVESPSC